MRRLLKFLLLTSVCISAEAIPSDVVANESKSNKPENQTSEEKRDFKQFYVDEQGFFTSGEFLYWQVLSGPSSQYAFIKNFPVWQSADGTVKDGLAGRAAREKYNWNPGYRFKLGYQISSHDHWEIIGQYTWYQTKGTSRIALSPDAPEQSQPGATFSPVQAIRSVFPTLSNNQAAAIIASSSRANLTYQIADLKLQKHLSPANYLTLAFNVDIQGGWFDQDWLLVSSGTNLIVGFFSPFPYPGETKTKLGWKYWGIGPGLGLNTDWYCSKDWIIFVNGNCCLLTGPHTTSLKTLQQAGTFNQLLQKISPNDIRFVPHTQLQFGLSWNYRFSQANRPRFVKCYAAFEQNVLFNLVEVYRYYSNRTDVPTDDVNYAVQGDPLQLYGLTVGFDIAF